MSYQAYNAEHDLLAIAKFLVQFVLSCGDGSCIIVRNFVLLTVVLSFISEMIYCLVHPHMHHIFMPPAL